MLPGPGDRDVERLKRGLRVLAPHMQRAMRISDRIATLDLAAGAARAAADAAPFAIRSEEHTSELQSLMRISYAVFCLKKKKIPTHIHKTAITQNRSTQY